MKEIIVSGASPVLMPREDPAGKILFLVLAVIFIVLSYTALVTLLAAMLRDLTNRARQIVADSPLQTVLTGVVGWALFGGLAAWLYSLAFVERLLETEIVPAYFIGACAAVIVPSLICVLGAPGLYSHIGDRLDALRDRETSDLGRVILGSVVALIAASFPFVGWFLVIPLLLVAEFGAGFRSLFR
jgi:hypothetical protein